MSSSSPVITARPTPRPRSSGATLTPATPAIGTARPYHHWRISMNSALPTIRSPSNAPRHRPSATIGSMFARTRDASTGPNDPMVMSRYLSQSRSTVSGRTVSSVVTDIHGTDEAGDKHLYLPTAPPQPPGQPSFSMMSSDTE